MNTHTHLTQSSQATNLPQRLTHLKYGVEMLGTLKWGRWLFHLFIHYTAHTCILMIVSGAYFHSVFRKSKQSKMLQFKDFDE